MKTALIVMDDGDHVHVTTKGEEAWIVFRQLVAAVLADHVWRTRAVPAHLVSACGRDLNGGTGPREIFEVLDMCLGLWDGSKWVTAPSGATHFRDYQEAVAAAREMRDVIVRPLRPKEQAALPAQRRRNRN